MISRALCIVLLATSAQAHDALTGWTYDFACCGSTDCRQIRTDAVKETKAGYIIKATGELIPYNDKRIKRSHDEFFHQCVSSYAPTKSICLYVPDRGF